MFFKPLGPDQQAALQSMPLAARVARLYCAFQYPDYNSIGKLSEQLAETKEDVLPMFMVELSRMSRSDHAVGVIYSYGLLNILLKRKATCRGPSPTDEDLAD
jgi:hypothetical protein